LYLQVFRSRENRALALSFARRLRRPEVRRGNIYDVNGVLLAASFKGNRASSTLALDWDMLEKGRGRDFSVGTLLELGVLCNLTPDDLEKALRKASEAEVSERPLHWLPIPYRRSVRDKPGARIPPEPTKLIQAYVDLKRALRGDFWAQGVVHETTDGRYYTFRTGKARSWPYWGLCREILGTVDVFGAGIVGVEGGYDTLLRGIPGWVEERHGALKGFLSHVPEDGIGVRSVEPAHLYLTIDTRLQKIAADALREEIQRQGAEKGSILIMDPSDGALRALVTWPPQKSPEGIFQVYEPGSVFKVFVATEALLERKVSVPGPVIWPGGGRRFVRGRRKPVEDAHAGHNLTFADGLIRSSNIVFSIVAERLGSRGMRRLVERFALTEAPDLARRLWPAKPKEAGKKGKRAGFTPWRLPPGPIHRQDVISMGWGNAVMVTCLSLARAYSAVVNGGYLVEPHVIAALQRPGEGIRNVAPPRGPRVIKDEKVLRTMRDLLRRVVEDEHGTAHRLRIEGLRFGAKTGTAKKHVPKFGGYNHRRFYTGGFIAHAPAGNPRYVIVAKVDVDRHKLKEPHLYYGSWTAGPIVRKILEALFRVDGQ